MDREVPAYVGVGLDGDDLRALDDYFLFSHEPFELLLRGDGAGGGAGISGVQETPSLINPPDPPPPLPTYYTAGGPSGTETPSEADMASWLGQVFEQEPRGGATATTIKSEGGNAEAVPGNRGGGDDGEHPPAASSGAAECRRGPSSSGRRRRRSCSGKAAEKRRRSKISDKLRTLHQMLPSCSKVKTDQASTLEEVIKYVKSLQHQVQVMSANGFAIPMPIWPLGVMPPPWMQPPAGDVLSGQAPVMLPPYPVFPTVYVCPPHGTPLPLPLPLPAPYTRHHPAAEPAGSGGRQQLAPRRPLAPNDLTVPRSAAGEARYEK